MSDLRTIFKEGDVSIVDCSGEMPRTCEYWSPVLIAKAQIEAEIERLTDLALPEGGRRQSLFVHPQSRPDCPSLAPGIRVTLSVLRPGESTKPFRHNGTEVNFCIRGAGHALLAGRKIDFKKFDVWNTPSYTPYQIVNDTDELQVRLTYTNAPLLEFMEVHLFDDDVSLDDGSTAESDAEDVPNPRGVSPFGIIDLGLDGAQLMPYERLINPPSVESKVLHWPWLTVKSELDKLEALGKDYVGRRLYLLYNPMTGRTNGTTPSFFSTITTRPPKIVDRPHRHVSASINYYFHGSGHSVVAGNKYEWEAGDLMLSAPGWAVHNHASYDDYVYELTVQDQPLNIIMESLLWQENMKQAPALLGAQVGFNTNR